MVVREQRAKLESGSHTDLKDFNQLVVVPNISRLSTWFEMSGDDTVIVEDESTQQIATGIEPVQDF